MANAATNEGVGRSDEQPERNAVTEANSGGDQNDPGARHKHWINAAITLLLLLIVIITGSAAIYYRGQWWEMYMRLTH